MKTIEIRRLAATSIYKLLFIGLFPPLFLTWLYWGIRSSLGHSTLQFNDQYVYGIKGLLIALACGIVLPVIVAFFLSCLIELGMWLWSKFAKIKISFYE